MVSAIALAVVSIPYWVCRETLCQTSVADLNSFKVEPIARPNCGNFFGPKIIKAIMLMTTRLVGAGDAENKSVSYHDNQPHS